MSTLNVVFMGTPSFVVPVLEAVERLLPEIDGRVVAVYTAPEKPAGRGRRLAPSPVGEYAASKRFAVLTPLRLRSEREVARFESLGVDLVVLAAYGLILPAPFLFGPRHGAVNVHPSLLPRYRGASPVAAAILAGDRVTGTTIMRMDEGLDTGPILEQREVALDGTERTPQLTDRLFRLGAAMLEDCLPRYVRGEVEAAPQPDEGVSVVKRFAKEDAMLDWSRPAIELERRVRAFDPWPGTATVWRGERVEVLTASLGMATDAAPGTVVREGKGIAVATGDGSLVLGQVRPAGRKAMDATAFVVGRPEFVGAALPS